MTQDSVSVAVGGSVPWDYDCESCGKSMLYVVEPWGAEAPRYMFCGNASCPEWLRQVRVRGKA